MPSSSSSSSSTHKAASSTAGRREDAVASDAQERITGQSEKRESSTAATFVSAVLSMSPLNNKNHAASKSPTGSTAQIKVTSAGSDPTMTVSCVFFSHSGWRSDF